MPNKSSEHLLGISPRSERGDVNKEVEDTMHLKRTINVALSFASLLGVLSQALPSEACQSITFNLSQPLSCFDSNGAIGTVNTINNPLRVQASLDRKSNQAGSGAIGRGLNNNGFVRCITPTDNTVGGKVTSPACLSGVNQMRIDAF